MVALRCLVGRHQRSKSAIKRAGERYVSICERCGTPLEKPLDRSRDWRVLKEQ